MSALNRLTLILNNSYEAIHIASARRAITMICKGVAVVEVVSPYVVKTARMEIPVPSVIRLLKYRRVPRLNRSVSRRGILLRDGNVCQYCAAKSLPGQLTLDHVTPKSRGGQSTWENLVAACRLCNNRKASRTPEEAGMILAKKPRAISLHAKNRLLQGADNKDWDRYLFA